jgi:hypothetical protein
MIIPTGYQAVGDWNAAVAQPGGPGQGLSGGLPGQLHPIQVLVEVPSVGWSCNYETS